MQVLTTLHKLASKVALPLLVIGLLAGCSYDRQELLEKKAEIEKQIEAQKGEEAFLANGNWGVSEEMTAKGILVVLNTLKPEQIALSKVACYGQYFNRCHIWYPRCGKLISCGESGDIPPEGAVIE